MLTTNTQRAQNSDPGCVAPVLYAIHTTVRVWLVIRSLSFLRDCLGLSDSQTGLLLTLTLVGDTVVSLYLTTRADRIGRRRMLIVGAILMAAAGLAFAFTHNFLLLILAGTLGVISPSGNEVRPFLSIEQAALSHVIPGRTRTEVFAWYTLAGSLATALGALRGGTLAHELQKTAMRPVGSYRVVVILYAALGICSASPFTRLSSAAEVNSPGKDSPAPGTLKSIVGISRSRHVLVKLASLVPLMPILSLAVLVPLMRFSISQMDVPTRQSYTMAVVSVEVRSAAAGITGVARTTAAAISTLFVGLMFCAACSDQRAILLCGNAENCCDPLHYREFAGLRPPEETS